MKNFQVLECFEISKSVRTGMPLYIGSKNNAVLGLRKTTIDISNGEVRRDVYNDTVKSTQS
jgi:hypothetical protein